MKMTPEEIGRPPDSSLDGVDIELPLRDEGERQEAQAQEPEIAAASGDSDLVPLTPSRASLPPLGTLLYELGLLSMADIDRTLQYQQQHGIRFGEAAIRLKLVKRQDVSRALAKQFAYPFLTSPPDAKTLGDELVTAYQPFSPEAEQLQALRSQLMLRWFDPLNGRQVLAVTGTGRGDGRSYIAANLAILFAQMGERTLLVDADLRRPRLHELFMLKNRTGLSTLLAGRSGEEAIAHIAEMPGLSVLPAGPVPPNPLELLHRRAFVELLEQARRRYALVLIDTPGAQDADDGMLVAARAGAAIVVANKRRTRMAEFSDLMQGLVGAGVAVVGSVLNEGARRPAA